MTAIIKPDENIAIDYPDSDGERIADNTEQFDWIVKIKMWMDIIFADNPKVFVAGALLWYPVEGNNKIRIGADVLVAFGRPQGRRGSYKQWEEAGIAPQVAFEVLSPEYRHSDTINKWRFYDRYGVEEFYLIDPDNKHIGGWLRQGTELEEIAEINNWISPRLQIRFEVSDNQIQLYHPDGRPFLSYVELVRECQVEQQRADRHQQRVEQASQRAQRLAERLRALGIDPDAV